jgi:HAD superfamily hydrolase (TIGR01490 family)
MYRKNKKKDETVLALFDFDGTIIRGDSFSQFLRFSQNKRGKFLFGIVIFLPLYLFYFAGILSEEWIKETHLKFFCGGWSEEFFTQKCQEYCSKALPPHIKESAMKSIQWHKDKGHEVVVVSGTLDRIILPWCKSQHVSLIATRIEIRNHHVTGRITGDNCTGSEKIRRISEQYDIKAFDSIYAYGNSRGDREMLGISNYPFFKNFK